MPDRRDFLALAAAGGGAVFASALGGCATPRERDFYFVQLSDTHWGFEGPPNPDARGTLKKAVAAVTWEEATWGNRAVAVNVREVQELQQEWAPEHAMRNKIQAKPTILLIRKTKDLIPMPW